MNQFDEDNCGPLPPPDYPRIPRDRVADTGNAVVTVLCTAILSVFAAVAFARLLADWMLP